jgi:antirestriction protein ArdC
VKKGEHGIAIMAPVVWRRKARDDVDKQRHEDPDNEVVSTFKAAYVFDISQTEGKPLPEFAKARGDPGSYLERLERFISGRGIKLERHESLRMEDGRGSLDRGHNPAEGIPRPCRGVLDHGP